MGDGMKRAFAAAKKSREPIAQREAYLVVCADGEITGQFGVPCSVPLKQADSMNRICNCGGPHQVIRMVQEGVGRTVAR